MMFQLIDDKPQREPWNKSKMIGQKKPLKLKEIWRISFRLQMANDIRDLALFNLAIDSKLRGCDLMPPPWRRDVAWPRTWLSRVG